MLCCGLLRPLPRTVRDASLTGLNVRARSYPACCSTMTSSTSKRETGSRRQRSWAQGREAIPGIAHALRCPQTFASLRSHTADQGRWPTNVGTMSARRAYGECMTARGAAALVMASSAVAAGGLLLLARSAETPTVPGAPAARAEPAAAPAPPPKYRRGTTVVCSRRSEATFPGAFTSSRNLVVGPLVLVGATYTPASVVREFGGNKFQLLVKAGHSVSVRVSRGARRSAGLAYAGLGKRALRQGREVRLRDAAPTMTFVACRPGSPPKHYRPEGPSGSDADGEA